MFYGAKRLKPRRFNAKNIFRREFWITFPVKNFNVREFPQMRIHHPIRALADKKFPISLDDECDKSSGGCLLAFSQIRQFLDAIVPESHAEFFHGTNPALRIARQADQSAEFHE